MSNGTGNGTLQKIKENVEHPGKASFGMLAGGLLVAIGPWLAAFDSWADAGAVSNVGVLLGIGGGVFISWLGKSPKVNN